MSRWSRILPAPDTALYIVAGDRGIRQIFFASTVPEPAGPPVDRDALIDEAARQLALYFEGRLREFDLPIEMEGTPFQQRVWAALRQIPYGETRSYAELAATVGSPKGFRAVGAANGRNPVPIVVPCHRVIESNGGLGGFSCGIAYKRRLLDLEGRYRVTAQ